MTWEVLCDFDHTITTQDVTDQLLEKHALPEWRKIEALWEKGYLGSQACMQQQIDLLRATPAQVENVADAIPIDPHFKSFANLCAKLNIPLIIVSDGLDYIIRHILKSAGLSHLHIIASHLEYVGDERWALTSPFASADCASQASTCKCAMARHMRTITRATKTLYIGDGRSDFCVSMEEADMILAKDSLLIYCRQHHLPHKSFETFAQASQLLAALVRQPEHAQPATVEGQLYA